MVLGLEANTHDDVLHLKKLIRIFCNFLEVNSEVGTYINPAAPVMRIFFGV
jgi:hypothetical protein